MIAKYSLNAHPCMNGLSLGCSYTWQRMQQVKEVAEQHIRFIVRSGNSNFWFDNWLGSGALAMRLDNVSDHYVGDFINNGHWNFQLLNLWVSLFILPEIHQVSPPMF